MAQLTRTQLKALWIDGFIPDQDDYADFFDSFRSMFDLTNEGYTHPHDTYVEKNVLIPTGIGAGYYDLDPPGNELSNPVKLTLSNPLDPSFPIFDVSLTYKGEVYSELTMTVESIDDPVNAGRKALRILAIFDENTEEDFSLSGTMQIFTGVNTVVDSQTFNFDGSTPEILIDNIDPAASSTAMRLLNNTESDLICANTTSGDQIKTFGTSVVFNNTFTYSEYINGGNTSLDRVGNYTTNQVKTVNVPKGKILLNNINEIVVDLDGLTGNPEFFNVKIDYEEVLES